MNVFKRDAQKKMIETLANQKLEKQDWRRDIEALESEFKIAKSEADAEKEVVSQLKNQIGALEEEMARQLKELKEQLEAEIEEVTLKKDNDISAIKLEAECVQKELIREKEDLAEKLCMSEKCTEELKLDLEEAKIQLTNELIQFKEKTQIVLDDFQMTVQSKESQLLEKNEIIETLEMERMSVREMFRIQRSLVKKRIAKRFSKG